MPNKQETCIALLEKIRWNNQPVCPYCESKKAAKIKKEQRYHCNECFTSFSVTVGTIFHKTHVELPKWFRAIELAIEISPKISARKLAVEVGVNKNTAAYMLSRIRQAAKSEESLFLEQILQTALEYETKISCPALSIMI